MAPFQNIDQVSNGELKLYTSVTLSVQDLELLQNMADRRDIDYTEIDRILSGLFTPVKMNSTRGNSRLKIYDQVSNCDFYSFNLLLII